MFLVSTVIKALALICYFIIVLLTLKSNTERRIRRYFNIYLSGMMIWQLSSLIAMLSKDTATALFWYKLLTVGISLQSFLLFPFTRAFLHIQRQKVLTYLSYGLCIVISASLLFGIQFEKLVPGKGGYYIPEFSTMMYLMAPIAYFFWGYSVFNLIHGHIKEQSPLQKNRIKYPLVGALLVFVGTASNLTPLQDYPIDIICNLINALLIGYAVIRYRLLDIRIALKRSFFYLISLLALLGIYILSVFALQKIFQDSFKYSSFWAGVISLLIVLSIFLVLTRRKEIQNFFTSLFFKEKLTYQKVLENFTRRANSTLDIDILVNLFVTTVFDTMRVNCSMIMLLDKDREQYSLRKRQCVPSIAFEDFTISEQDPFIRQIMGSGKPIWKEETRIDPYYSHLLEESELVLTKPEISIIVPILHKESQMGLLIVGEKLSGELYTDDDMRFLITITNITATAIANSLSYKEIERRLSEQTLLFVLSKTLGKSIELETVIDSVLKILIYFLNLDYCAIITFADSNSHTSFFSTGFSITSRKEIEQFCAAIGKKPEKVKRNGSGILLDVNETFANRDDLSKVDRDMLLSSIYVLLEHDDNLMGLMVMSNWIGSGREEQRLDILRTILAIVTQGLMMHQTVSDLASMKSYNENIIESINTMGDMLIVFGYDGKIRRVNEATCNRLGYRERELKGKDIGIIFKKKDSILTDMKERQSIKNLEITFLTQRGESVFVLFSSTIMENSAGETEEIVGMARDITNIKETEKKYRSLFEEVKDVVFSADLNGQLLDINPAGLELLEFSSEKEALETNLKDTIFSEKTAYDTFCAKLKKDGYVRNYELSLMNRKGKEVNVILTANVIRNTAGEITAYRGIMKDITEQRALQRQLIQAQKMESIGTLAGGVAHDFNNIMTAILGYASIMKMNITDDHPFSNYLNTIESSANRAAQLTNQLLAFARAGKHNVKVFNINTIVKETVDLIKETFNRSINIESSLGEELPFIEGDANQIQQIIMNLCVNARDAMPDGGMLTVRTDAARITRRYVESHLGAKKGDYVRLTVSDTGVGIDERIIGRIFDPFFTTKGPGEGTGLGLSVVYGVVKNHGGYIDARSKLGEGSIFEIFFPVARGVRAEEKEEEREPPTGKHEMILIIDDEETVRSLAKEILEKYGYRTLLASDGEEGVALFRKNRSKVKLVIIDMIMPKLNGLETYQVITKIDPDAKAVLSTGYDHSERVKEILDSGVKGFIKKPYNVRELLSQVRNVLDS